VLYVLTIALGTYAAAVAGLYLFQRHLLYHPSANRPSIALAAVPEMAVVTLATEDGLTLESWYAAARDGAPTLVYFHGNAGHIGHRGFKVRPYLDAGWGVLLVGYRGFGGNSGAPSETGLYADARAALAFLDGEGVPAGRRLLYGESLGTGIAVRMAAEAAAKTPVAAVILEAPYTAIADVAAEHYPFVPARLMMRDRFDALSWIGAIGAPLLVVHGERDHIVPTMFGKALFAAAAEPKTAHWIENAGHNDLHEYGLARLVMTFVADHTGARAASPRAALSR
jgi:fermentation-respiration switch protein FrsA (DUF1100 family)